MNKNDFLFHNTGYIPSVITGLIAVLLWIFVLWPNLVTIPTTDESINELTAKVDLMSRQKKALDSFNDSELEEISQKTEIALPTEKSFPGLLSGLEFLAQQAHSQLVSFDSAPGVISSSSGKTAALKTGDALPSGMGGLNAFIRLNSNSANLIDLADSLIKSGRLVTIEQIDFDSQNNKGELTNTGIKIKVYFQPRPTNPEDITKLSSITTEEKSMVDRVDSYNQFTLQSVPDLPSRPDPFANFAQQRSSSPSGQL